MVKFEYQMIDGVRIFFREAPAPGRPCVLLLHGFPSASHMFRNFIAGLAGEFQLVAPDYPGFGMSDAPPRESFAYTFDHLAEIIEKFTEARGIDRFFMYVFDYGAPIGFRLALRHPERILGIISQNGNIYEEGLGSKWQARAAYWQHPTPELRRHFQSAFDKKTIIGQYTFGTEPGSVSPDGYGLDIYYTEKPGYAEIQSDLIFDYQHNVRLYPRFQQYLRTHRPPLLAVWGRNDPSFIPAGAQAFLKDQPGAEIHLVNSGHFALESCCDEIVRLSRDFLLRHDVSQIKQP